MGNRVSVRQEKSRPSTLLPLIGSNRSYLTLYIHSYRSHSEEKRYLRMQQIGEGKYSHVYEGFDTWSDQKCVLKVLKKTRKVRKITKEIKVLKLLQGGPNIISLYDVIYNATSANAILVFEHVENRPFGALYRILSLDDIRFYLFQILKSLRHAHSKGIMHRDIKPHNIAIDHSQRKLRVLDWGLAEFYEPGKSYRVRVSTLNYKAPELLVKNGKYDYSLDIWSFGYVLAEMLLRKHEFFRGKDKPDLLKKIVKVLGTDELLRYIKKYNITLGEGVAKELSGHKRKPWSSFVFALNAHLETPEGLDLLDKVLVYDHKQRLTAEEAMKHPFFDPIRSVEAV